MKALILTLLLAAGLPAADPALLNLIMPDARTVAGVDVERARNSAFGQFVLSQMIHQNADLDRFSLASGFDPRRDVREILIASTAVDQGHDKGLVLARGAFDVPRLIAAMKAEHATAERYMGVDLLVGSGHDHGAVAFLDSTTAVAGQIDNVKAVIQRRRAGGALDPRIAQKIQQVSARHDLWVSTTVPVSTLAGHVPDPNLGGALKGDVLKGIEQASGGLRFGAANVEVSGEAVARSDKDATALADVLRFLASMVQMNRDNKNAGELAKVLDTMDVRTEANVLKFSLSIPEDQIERMVKPRAPRKAAAI